MSPVGVYVESTSATANGNLVKGIVHELGEEPSKLRARQRGRAAAPARARASTSVVRYGRSSPCERRSWFPGMSSGWNLAAEGAAHLLE